MAPITTFRHTGSTILRGMPVQYDDEPAPRIRLERINIGASRVDCVEFRAEDIPHLIAFLLATEAGRSVEVGLLMKAAYASAGIKPHLVARTRN